MQQGFFKLKDIAIDQGTDISSKGMGFIDGGALLHFLVKMLCQHMGVQMLVVQDPLVCVAKDCGMTLEHIGESAKFSTEV